MFDLLIKNGMILDGTGRDGYRADIGIRDGKIVAIDTTLSDGKQVLDATDLTVTPGFIDSHSHSDGTALNWPLQAEKAEQGITTSIAGQCGSTQYPKPLGDKLLSMHIFMDMVDLKPQGSHIATFVGHRALRVCVMGMENREPTGQELEQMKGLLRSAMEAGAMGISFGLIYTPSCYAKTDELIELAKVAGQMGGMISAHIRDERDGVIEAVKEFITIAKAAGVRGVVSHHKAAEVRNHGKVKTTLAMLEQANREGCDLYCDVYPYVASATRLSATFIPIEYDNGKVVEYLKDPALRAQFKERNLKKFGPDLSWVQILHCTAYPEYTGLRVSEAAKLHGKDHYETVFDIICAQPGCQAAYFTLCEEDVKTVMAWDRSMICTDSGVRGDKLSYHPRLRGSFPRVLGRYVRQQQVTGLPEMIRKITGLPAHVYGLSTKGRIAVGMDADLCIFDAQTIIDRAEFTNPHLHCEGLRWVIVDGVVAVENAVCTGATPGKLLRRKTAQ